MLGPSSLVYFCHNIKSSWFRHFTHFIETLKVINKNHYDDEYGDYHDDDDDDDYDDDGQKLVSACDSLTWN